MQQHKFLESTVICINKCSRWTSTVPIQIWTGHIGKKLNKFFYFINKMQNFVKNKSLVTFYYAPGYLYSDCYSIILDCTLSVNISIISKVPQKAIPAIIHSKIGGDHTKRLIHLKNNSTDQMILKNSKLKFVTILFIFLVTYSLRQNKNIILGIKRNTFQVPCWALQEISTVLTYILMEFTWWNKLSKYSNKILLEKLSRINTLQS
jgi:hypothetical protein